MPGTAIVRVGLDDRDDLFAVQFRWWQHSGYTPVEACDPEERECDFHEGVGGHGVHYGHEDWDWVNNWEEDGIAWNEFRIEGLEFFDVPYDPPALDEPIIPNVRFTKQMVERELRTVNLQLRLFGSNDIHSDPSRVSIFNIWGGGCGRDDLGVSIPVEICLDEEVLPLVLGLCVYAGVYSSFLDDVTYDLDGIHHPPGGVRHRHSSGAATYPVGPATIPVEWDGTPVPPESIPTKPAPPSAPVVLEGFQVEDVEGTVRVRMGIGGSEWQYSLEHRWWVDGDLEPSPWVTTALLSGDSFLVTHKFAEPGEYGVGLAEGLPLGSSVWVNIQTRARSIPEGLASGATGVLRVEVKGGGADWAY